MQQPAVIKYVREDSDDEDDAADGGAASRDRSLAAPDGAGYLGGEGAGEVEPLAPAACAACDSSSSAAGGASGSGEPDYSSNYAADGTPAVSGGPVAATVDISEVDESLFLDEDLPDDDELE